MDVETRRLGYSEYGDPSQVVSLVTERMVCDLKPGQVSDVDTGVLIADLISGSCKISPIASKPCRYQCPTRYRSCVLMCVVY